MGRRGEDGGVVQTGPEAPGPTEARGVRVGVPLQEDGPRHDDGDVHPEDVSVRGRTETWRRVSEHQEREPGGQREVQMFHPKPEEGSRSSAAC